MYPQERLLYILFDTIYLLHQVQIEQLVTAMGGVLHTKASQDVSFVIVKNVLATYYKVCF